MFFFNYLSFSLEISVENIFYTHIYQIMRDIIKLKKNDVLLSQNELNVAGPLIVEVIERKNFNPTFLLGPNEDLEPFKRLGGSLYKYVYKIAHENITLDPHLNKTRWYTGTIDHDEDAFHRNIYRLLKGMDIDKDYKDFNKA